MNAPTPPSPGPPTADTTPPAAASPRLQRPLEICIASPEFVGPASHGPDGLAFTAMAQSLAAAGHHVTCLLLDAKASFSRDWQRWVEKYRADGLALVALPQINASELVAPPNLIKSYEAFHWLKKNDRFDLIHFPERQGPAYHTVTAKHHGLGFARATICVGLHSMTAWLRGGGAKSPRATAEVDTDFLERRAVALADAVVGPGQNIIDCMAEPRRDRAGTGGALAARTQAAPEARQIHELVYFGTLETSKGAVLFCDALDALPAGVAAKIQAVTFLGRESIIDGIPGLNYIRKRAQRWPFPHQFIADLRETSTLDYLRQEHRLAVIPTLRESSLYLVLECLVARIAFIASRVGGVTELIARADIDHVCFEPDADSLRSILCDAMSRGIRPARAVVEARASDPASGAWQGSLPIRPEFSAPTGGRALTPCHDAGQAAIHALSIDPNDIVALKILTRMHLSAGMIEAAEEACLLILKSHPDDAEAQQMLDEARQPQAVPSAIQQELSLAGQ